MIRRPPRSTLFPYTTLIPLSKAVDSLAAELAHGVPLGVPVPDAGAASLDELAGRAEALTAIAHEGRDLTAVRRGLLADVGAQVESLARTAVATGGAAVDAMPLADGGLRATAHSALAGIATLLERQQDPLGGLVGYTSSWSAVSASQASAEAAAAAAAANAGVGRGQLRRAVGGDRFAEGEQGQVGAGMGAHEADQGHEGRAVAHRETVTIRFRDSWPAPGGEVRKVAELPPFQSGVGGQPVGRRRVRVLGDSGNRHARLRSR